jgi:TIR domain/Pentapeptide repeats (8 copies)
MANHQHLARLKEGVQNWNQWIQENLVTLDLSGAHLSKANLSGGATLSRVNLNGAYLNGANLSGADLSGASLSGAYLNGADLYGAHLYGADLRDADLRDSDLRESDLSWANLGGANLGGAFLYGAHLYGVNLSGVYLRRANLGQAYLGWTIFVNTDLSETNGMELCHHDGPSSVGIDTLIKSHGNIPEIFLQGCGVPEQFIGYARSLVAQPIEFYSCFISYSTQDQEFATRLHADLRAKNLRCWFAPEDLKIGDRFQERIEESIRLFDKVMIVLSDASVQSRWVAREVNAASEREDRENRTILFPIRIDNAVMNAPQSWAADIRRTRHIGDFSSWKDRSSYLKAFERLLRDLESKDQSDG